MYTFVYGYVYLVFISQYIELNIVKIMNNNENYPQKKKKK